MANKAKSDTKKVQLAREAIQEFTRRAITAYQAELNKPNGKGARTVAKDFINLYKLETGKDIRLSYSTLIRGANGHRSRAESNASRSWLTDDEVEVILAFIIEVGNRGFPLSHRRLKEHVDEILRARLGDQFPALGVGARWTNRFIERYSARIKTSWSTTLDTKRGRAVNPNTINAWFSLLGNTMTHYHIDDPALVYGTDEVGCNPADGRKERVIGARKNGPQYQQRDGVRENITVIVTICADGTSTPPAVIFKGQAYQVSWKQNNPANASLGYSKKGWTNGAIGIEWIKQFDQHTKEKANGRYRLLIVDGHNSHYTRGFLQYARAHQILVICYPAHATHILQGLDVVVFAIVKRCLTEERDQWEFRTGEKLSKKNFLEIYGHAHLRALTPKTIKSAFRATGAWPFNSNVIKPEAMAPSKETSRDSYLPLAPSESVQAVVALLQKLSLENQNGEGESGDEEDEGSDIEGEDDGDGESESESEGDGEGEIEVRGQREQVQGGLVVEGENSGSRDVQNGITDNSADGILMGKSLEAVRETISKLSKGELAEIVSTGKITSATELSHNTNVFIAPMATPTVLSIIPETLHERLLLAALRESTAREEFLQKRLIESQAANILNEAYCARVKSQLAYQEEKAANPKGKGKLMGNGLPCLLSGDEFYEKVVEHEAAQKQGAREKMGRQERRNEHAEALVEYNKQKDARDEAVAKRRAEWVIEKEEWEAAKACAKAEGKRFSTKKPLLGPLPDPPTRPKANSTPNEPEADDDDDESAS